VGAAERIEAVPAHSGPVWSLAALPDSSGAQQALCLCCFGGQQLKCRWIGGTVAISAVATAVCFDPYCQLPSLPHHVPCVAQSTPELSSLLAGFVSGSADHELKFWEWQLTTGPVADGGGSGSTTSRRLGIRHTRTLKMTDDVLCVRISPDGKPVSLLAGIPQCLEAQFLSSERAWLPFVLCRRCKGR
jgi:WD40 repeat protein